MKPLDPAARSARPELDVHLTENVLVPMRDGVRVATDIYRPARDGRCAVGSWGGQRPSLGGYVTGMGPTDGATAPPEGASVGYSLEGSPK